MMNRHDDINHPEREVQIVRGRYDRVMVARGCEQTVSSRSGRHRESVAVVGQPPRRRRLVFDPPSGLPVPRRYWNFLFTI